MAILRAPVRWRRTAKRDIDADLTPTEQANVRRALRFLAKRHGTLGKLADAMGAKLARIKEAIGRRAVSAGLALKASRVAKVPLEDVLAGRWPPSTMCPYCGRV